ncbi:hypothetical protein [Winogradskya humida]|uniref:Uncharacterized protein n=1 Tax=Winogradskya humida TaxID=113566 RepID=A0ABQ3ZWX6_9ACTN|nr:hypothetical protein [Actinoplanes humidus]GIE23091.1 hypothetical protein Ahu01nite_061930 [Actinoplanes humidus]
MLMPTAYIVAVRAVAREFEDARLDGPVRAQAEVPRLPRTRQLVSRVLFATARFVAVDEPRPVLASCAARS